MSKVKKTYVIKKEEFSIFQTLYIPVNTKGKTKMKYTMLVILTFLLSLSYGNEQLSHNRLQDQVTIVTGASKGIGKGISQVFAKEGAKLVLVARSEKLL